MAPAVKRRSSSILRHVTAAAAAITPGVDGNGEVATAAGGAAAAAATAAGGGGAVKRASLLSVAMRSRTAAAAVEGANYEEEVRANVRCFEQMRLLIILTALKQQEGPLSSFLKHPPSRSGTQVDDRYIYPAARFPSDSYTICSRSRGEGGLYSCHAWPYDHRPSHPYNAGTERFGFHRRGRHLIAPSAKRRKVLGESQEG